MSGEGLLERVRALAMEIDRHHADHVFALILRRLPELGLSEAALKLESEALTALSAETHTALDLDKNARAPALPERAPKLYIDRDKRRLKTPVDFVREVYGPWLGQGLERRHIRRLDPKLYVALSAWLTKHPALSDFDLPTRKESNDHWHAAVASGHQTLAANEVHRFNAVARRLRAGQKPA